MALTPEQASFYADHGYLVIERAIPEDRLTQIRAVIAEFQEHAKYVSRSNEIFDLGPGHSAVTPQIRRLKDPVKRHAVFDDLMRAPEIVDVVEALFGGPVRFDHSKLNFKPPGGHAEIAWHQDWAFYPHTNDDLLAVGVMIEDCTPENGPLMVVPGSHRGPVYDHHQNGVFVGGVPYDEIAAESAKAVSLTAPAGSISLHHVRTLHASSENVSDRERPLLLYSYSAVDAFPVFEKYDLKEYDSRIIRGAPTRIPRIVTNPMRLPLPQVKDADSIFDDQARLRKAVVT